MPSAYFFGIVIAVGGVAGGSCGLLLRRILTSPEAKRFPTPVALRAAFRIAWRQGGWGRYSRIRPHYVRKVLIAVSLGGGALVGALTGAGLVNSETAAFVPALLVSLGMLTWLWLKAIPVQMCLREQLIRLGYPTCIQCGYDTQSVVEPRCPECGSDLTVQAQFACDGR